MNLNSFHLNGPEIWLLKHCMYSETSLNLTFIETDNILGLVEITV